MMGQREQLPDTRRSLTHQVEVSDASGGGGGVHTVFITAGFYEDGRLGEVFLNIGKQGSTMRGLTDTIARQFSYAMQYGLPFDELAAHFKDMAFPPAGPTSNPEIPECKSVVDYLFRWLELAVADADAPAEDAA